MAPEEHDYESWGKWRISMDGGSLPVWSRDGKDLFSIDADGKMMALDVKGGSKFEAGLLERFLTRTWKLGLVRPSTKTGGSSYPPKSRRPATLR